MQGLYYLFSLIAIGLVIFWYIQNDDVGPHDDTSGLFAMKRRKAGKEQEKPEAKTHRLKP